MNSDVKPRAFPTPMRRHIVADVPLDYVTAYLSQAETHQLLFMDFSEDVELGEHQQEAQW